MKWIRATLLGGLMVVLPASLAVLLVARTVAGLQKVIAPAVERLPGYLHHPAVVAGFLLLLASFLAGLLMRTSAGGALERSVLNRIPGYPLLRAMSRRMAGEEEGAIGVALVVLEEALAPAFVMERHDDGRFTVFVPTAPMSGTGALYIMGPERVHPLDVPVRQVLKCFSQWGLGARELAAAMKNPPGRA